ncbi:MFS transporter [Aliamphritea spongicola]|uniref:MFS transporter n=1 Tax=Aliamphritea spongicola TaxID=707589 RepID=UPI00196AFFDD|nr:MFS transporter [Aliamphritea spongicola]MBN3561125.1 MFS transporter [Aliamphritea spongicola]
MQQADTQQPPWLALFSICLAAFLVPMAMAAVNLALPSIADDLHIDAVYLSWVPSAPLWGSVVLMLPVARLADLYGRRRIHLYGLALYAGSSVVVAWVDQIEWLLFYRVLQGLSSSFIFATSMAMVASLAGSARRGMFLGIVSTSVYLGLTLGPVAGGWLTELLGWRSVFWLPVPGIILALALVLRFVPTTPRTEQDSSLSFSQRLDLSGSLIFMLCTSCLFFGITGLPDPRFMGVLFAGIVLCWCFVRHQRQAKAPLVRIDAMRQNRIFTRSILASICMYGASFPVLFILSLYLQYIQGLSPGEAGSIILIQALLMACIAPVAGRLSDRYEARVIATVGCGMFVLGFVVLFFAGMSSPLWQIKLGLCLLGIGFGLFSSPNNNAAMGSVDPARLGIAAALLNLARTAGNMFSTTIMVVIFNHYFGEKVLQPEDYPQLLVVVKIAVLLGGAYALAGGYFSLTRGRMR